MGGDRFFARLAAPVAVVSLLLVGVGVAAAWAIDRFHRSAVELLAVNVASVRAASELENAVREVQGRLDRFLLTGERGYLDAVPDLRRRADHWLDEAERVATTPRERDQVARTRQGYAAFFAAVARAAAGDRGGTPARDVLREGVLAPAHEYLDYNADALETWSRDSRVQANRVALAFALLGCGGAGAGLAAGLWAATAVRRSIVRVEVGLRGAAGQLAGVAGPVTVGTGDLDDALARLTGPLGTVVRRLEESQREALRAEQLAMVGQMAAGIAHEVRNPLTAIKILVQAAAERGEAGALRGRHLRVLEEEIGRLERLISAFLDFARPPRPAKRPLDLGPAVAEAAELVGTRAGQCGVAVEAHAPPAGTAAAADPDQVRQLLLNLLLNALDVAPAGSTVRAEVAPGPGGDVLVRVEDRGPGLPPGLGQEIFRPFVSTKESGLGLGLSVCRRIAEDHGGDIEAADRPGGGAVFTVRFPGPTRTPTQGAA